MRTPGVLLCIRRYQPGVSISIKKIVRGNMKKEEKIFLVGYLLTAILYALFISTDIISVLFSGFIGACMFWLVLFVLPKKVKKIKKD